MLTARGGRQEFSRERHSTTHFLTYADNNAVGYFVKQGFSKEIMLERERWFGYIKVHTHSVSWSRASEIWHNGCTLLWEVRGFGGNNQRERLLGKNCPHVLQEVPVELVSPHSPVGGPKREAC